MKKKEFLEKFKLLFKKHFKKKGFFALAIFLGVHGLVALIGTGSALHFISKNNEKSIVLQAQKNDGLVDLENIKDEQNKATYEADLNSEKLDKALSENKTTEEKEILAVVSGSNINEPSGNPMINAIKNGEIINEFSLKLAFSDVTKDWRTHTGIDVVLQDKDVFSLYDGTVEKVYSDALLGKTVIISHDDGTKAVYQNLDTNVCVNEKDSIKSGDKIGYMGNTSVLEKNSEPHLHIEILKDSVPIDPITKIE